MFLKMNILPLYYNILIKFKKIKKMKKVISLFAVLALFVNFTFAQTAPATEAPQMSFETTTLDYGTIERGSDPLRVFTFTNTGNAPLVIKHAKGSCGCTVPSYKKEPIMPGESGEIEVRYDTKRVGKFTKTITLTTNTTEGKQILKITGVVNKAAPTAPAVPAPAKSILNDK